MATTGTVNVTVTSWDTLRFTWTLESQDIARNTSRVTWQLLLVSGSNGRIDSTASKAWSVTINGSTYSGTNTVGVGNNATKTLASGTTTIAHNADGSKTFSFSFSQEFAITFSGTSLGTKSGSGSGTLTTIPRASQPSLITWPESTENVGNFGATISIHMNRASSAFTHTVRYAFGDLTGTIATGVTTGTTWTVPLDWMNKIPNAAKGSGRVYVDTYNGNTKIGTKYTGFTATVPTSIRPTCSLQVLDATTTQAQYGNLVKGLSKLSVKATGGQAYSSPIVGYRVTANGETYTSAQVTTDVLKAAGTTTITATATDKRGRVSTTASASFTVLDYVGPSITALQAFRCTSAGVEDEQGEYIRVIFSAQITALNNKNSAAYAIKYKQSGTTTWTTVTLTAQAGKYTITDASHIFAADSSHSFDVMVEATDDMGTTTRTTSAPTAFTLMNWGANGTSMGIGKVAEKANTLEVALDAEFLGDTTIRGNRQVYSAPGTAGTAGYVLLARIQITAANADTPITFILSRRSAPTTMTVWVRFTNATATASTLTTIQYDGANYGAFLVQSSAMIWDLYVQKGSAYDTIGLQDWYTSGTMATRIAVTFPGTLVSAVPEPYHRATPTKPQSLLDYIFPIGTIVHRYDHTNPGTIYGGTWARIANQFLWACDAAGEIGTTGGAKEVTLIAAQLPAHTHNISVANTASGSVSANNKIRFNNAASSFVGTVASEQNTGGQAHNNMPPYIQVSIWRRTA